MTCTDNMLLPVSIQSQNSIASCWLSITHLVHPYIYVKCIKVAVNLEQQCSNVKIVGNTYNEKLQIIIEVYECTGCMYACT